MITRISGRPSCFLLPLYLFLLGLLNISGSLKAQQLPSAAKQLHWGKTITLPGFQADSGLLSNNCHTIAAINASEEITDSSYGSQYCRLLQIEGNHWLAVYTVSTNMGYQKTPQGGLRLEIAKSTDNGKNWTVIARLKDPGRDLDNGQLIQLKNGDILLAGRSVRWHESYRLPVYLSDDHGVSWTFLSEIDYNEGSAGSLGNPDKGVYEPHFTFLKDGRLAVFYANEKHVIDAHPHSQIISEKISSDNGRSWGEEIFVASNPNNKEARPGMPVCVRMKNDSFMVVYELCGTNDCNIFQKTSPDGVNWPVGVGTQIASQSGAPFLLSMKDGRLVVSSNRGNISVSYNYGRSWELFDRPWIFTQTYEADWHQALWPSLYQFGPGRIGVTAARKSMHGKKGYNVNIRYGVLK